MDFAAFVSLAIAAGIVTVSVVSYFKQKKKGCASCPMNKKCGFKK